MHAVIELSLALGPEARMARALRRASVGVRTLSEYHRRQPKPGVDQRDAGHVADYLSARGELVMDVTRKTGDAAKGRADRFTGGVWMWPRVGAIGHVTDDEYQG
jgi:hypothetical protein